MKPNHSGALKAGTRVGVESSLDRAYKDKHSYLHEGRGVVLKASVHLAKILFDDGHSDWTDLKYVRVISPLEQLADEAEDSESPVED